MVTTTRPPSPPLPRLVKSYEIQAQVNALRRTLAIAMETTPEDDSGRDEKIQQLQILISQLTEKKGDGAERIREKLLIREQLQRDREQSLLTSIQNDEKRRDDILREIKRERYEVMVERNEKYCQRTAASGDKLKDMAKTRTKKLIEIQNKRTRRMKEIEKSKEDRQKEQQVTRHQQHLHREEKVANIQKLQEEREQKLEDTRIEKDRTMTAKREKAEKSRTAKNIMNERNRKEVIERGGIQNDNIKRQEELACIIEQREKRIHNFRQQKYEDIRDRTKQYQEKQQKLDRIAEEDLTLKQRFLREYDKKKNSESKRIAAALDNRKREHLERCRVNDERRANRLDVAKERIENADESMLLFWYLL